MSGKIIRIYFFAILLIQSGLVYAQELNKQIVDEKSEKPMLIGYCNREAFQDTSYGWWFNSTYENYSLNPDTLSLIKPYISQYDIIIVMGTWCSDSRTEVPRFYKILDSTGYDYSRLKVINVGREMKDITGDVDELNVELVPTFIFYKNDNEKGRIVETPKGKLEEDIWNIIKEHVN